MKRLEIWIISGVLVLTAMLIFAFNYRFSSYEHQDPDIKHYTIERKWELPRELEEVSGISWIGNDELATVQDEDGIIYIYNLKSQKITESIEFAESGDYEELVVDDTTAYVLRSDGTLFEVLNYRDTTVKVTTYHMPKLKNSNMEAMALDKHNNRLLVIAKDKDPDADDRKGIYSFSLKTMEFKKEAVLSIDMNQEAFADFKRERAYKTLRPSAFSINPVSGDLYLLDGVRPKLLILDAQAVLQEIYIFDQSEFAQAEGLTFDPSGNLYISNEAHNEPANILLVSLKTRDSEQ